ncbi:MAG: CYTH domain-containing protein [Candidatus Zixiibacteriota bacterium]|nr:MAG: CYTH domain-containing protein [candidate division Zixibacteria bacterium]
MVDAELKLEVEIKLQLGSFTDYLKLVGYLGAIDSEQRHINAFFDSEDRVLARDGWALRVRAENTRGLVTLKSTTKSQGLAAVREELEAEIARPAAMDVLNLRMDPMALRVPPVEFVRGEYPGISPARLVRFENTRQKKRFMIGDRAYTLDIDRTEFSDGSVDYELEIELGSQDSVETVEDCVHKMFSTLEIPFVPQLRSKFERALEHVRLF